MPYNLVVITPDQLRQDFLGCYGNSSINSKNIDRLSKEGLTFDNLYCAAPLCAPSRISFATSTYLSEHNHRNYWSTINPDVPNIVQSLKRSGYKTGMFGKNHLFTYSRLNEVWDELDEICLGNYDGHPEYKHSYSAFTLEPTHPYNITERLTTETIQFIHGSSDPFFVWVNYQDPHPAFTCPPPYDSMYDPNDIELPFTWDKFKSEKQPVRNSVWRKHSEMHLCTETDMKKAIAYYMGQISYIDYSVGRILDALDVNGLNKKTIVLFFSDHGELLGDYRMTHKLPVFYDCLTKIPVIIRHPEKRWMNCRFTGLAEETDLAPTLLDMLGVEIPPTMVGTSWLDSLNNNDFSGKKNIICEAGGGAPTYNSPIDGLTLKAPHVPTSFGCSAMLREENYKLSIYADDRCELYDIKRDPFELDNLYDMPQYEQTQQDLTLTLLKRQMNVKTRDIGLEWNYTLYDHDVRFEPLEKTEKDGKDIEGPHDKTFETS
jgi:arylsulfatase A-like enzyme